MSAFENHHPYRKTSAWRSRPRVASPGDRQQLEQIIHSSGPGSPATGQATGPVTEPAVFSEGISAERQNLPLGGSQKRAMDLMIAIIALVAAAPIMLIVAVILWLSAGPATFSHRRVGFGGKPFNCYKFRSMVANAEDVLKAHLEANPEAAVEWEQTHKLRNDPRVTFFGHMLRKSSIDELPQLFNVIRGEMSCVGPRPIVSEELRHYGDHAGEYLTVRPGLTGLWQVSGRSNIDYDNRVALDSYYVQNWSPTLDVVILLRTIVAVMRLDQAA